MRKILLLALLFPLMLNAQTRVSERPFCFESVEVPGGCDLHIMLGDDLETVVKGPFDVAFYDSVKVGEIEYFYIMASKSGREEYIFDVVGNPLTPADLENLSAYYRQKGSEYHQRYAALPSYERITDENTKLLYCAALCGDPNAVAIVVLSSYTRMSYRKVVDWALHAEASQSAPALYFVGLCYLDGDGTSMDISLARHYLEKSRDLGYPKAAEKLAQIKNNGGQ